MVVCLCLGCLEPEGILVSLCVREFVMVHFDFSEFGPGMFKGFAGSR